MMSHARSCKHALFFLFPPHPSLLPSLSHTQTPTCVSPVSICSHMYVGMSKSSVVRALQFDKYFSVMNVKIIGAIIIINIITVHIAQ